MNAQKRKILIVGSGVSGLSAAYELLLAGHDVTIWSKEGAAEFPPTSLNAYAMWVPVTDTKDNRVEDWANASRGVFDALSADSATGVKQRKIVKLHEHPDEPWYAGKAANFRHPNPGEIPSEYADANVLDTAPVIDPTVYLPWLHAQVVALGGVFETRTIESFDDCPQEFEAILNCTGLGSRTLTGDTDLHAERVQVVKIRQSGFDDVVIDDDGPHKRACVVPHSDYIKLGAVFDGDIEDTTVSESATADILARCNATVPGLNARSEDVISVVRVHRPERSRTRVELVQLDDGRLLVNCYGHDGMGYILSWGIAQWIARQIAETLK